MKAIAPVAALLVSVSLLLTGNGLQGALLPLRASLDQQSALEIGILGSSYFLGFGVGCYLASGFIRRVGHIRVFTAAVAVASAVVLVHALIASPVVWWLLRAVTGLCFAALNIVIESWLADRSDEESRGAVFSIYTIINLTVITLGQAMLLLGDPASFPLFVVASGLLLLYGAGAVVGPIVASILASFLGLDAIFLATAIVHVSLASFILLRIAQNTVVVEGEEPSFAESLISAQTTMQIAPGPETMEEEGAP